MHSGYNTSERSFCTIVNKKIIEPIIPTLSPLSIAVYSGITLLLYATQTMKIDLFKQFQPLFPNLRVIPLYGQTIGVYIWWALPELLNNPFSQETWRRI